MYKDNEDKKRNGNENHIPLWEVYAMCDDKACRVDMPPITGDENSFNDILCNVNLFRPGS